MGGWKEGNVLSNDLLNTCIQLYIDRQMGSSIDRVSTFDAKSNNISLFVALIFFLHISPHGTPSIRNMSFGERSQHSQYNELNYE